MNCLSIDLGTCFSCMCYMDNNNIEYVKYNNSILIPSIVNYNKDIIFYGLKRLIGKKYNEINPDNYEYKIETNKNKDILIRVDDDTTVSIEKLYILLLKKLKDIAESYSKKTFKNCIITIPNKYNELQRHLIINIAQSVGLNCDKILAEAVAVAIAYNYTKNINGNILIYDIGGFTTDVTKLCYSSNTMDDNLLENTVIYDVLEIYGDECGGIEFDKVISKYYNWTLDKSRKYKESININSPQQEKNLFLSIIKDLIEKVIDNIINNILLDDVECIVLSGGGSKIYGLYERLKLLTNKNIIQVEDPKTITAKGALVYMNGSNDGNIILLDKLPLSIGIEDYQGNMITYFYRHSLYPCCATKTFTNYNNSNIINLRVFEGERKKVSNNKLLGEFVITLPYNCVQNTLQLDIKIDIDKNNLLKIDCVEKNLKLKIEFNFIKDCNNFNNEELNIMLLCSKIDLENNLINTLVDTYNNFSKFYFDKTYKTKLIPETAWYDVMYEEIDEEIIYNYAYYNDDENNVEIYEDEKPTYFELLISKVDIGDKNIDNRIEWLKDTIEKINEWLKVLDNKVYYENNSSNDDKNKAINLYNNLLEYPEEYIKYFDLNKYINNVKIENFNNVNYTKNFIDSIYNYKLLYKNYFELLINKHKLNIDNYVLDDELRNWINNIELINSLINNN